MHGIWFTMQLIHCTEKVCVKVYKVFVVIVQNSSLQDCSSVKFCYSFQNTFARMLLVMLGSCYKYQTQRTLGVPLNLECLKQGCRNILNKPAVF